MLTGYKYYQWEQAQCYHSIETRDVDYNVNYNPPSRPGIAAQLCDFSYAIDGGNQTFLFESPQPNKTISETGMIMNLTNVAYSTNYCGNAALDTDADGVNDVDDNCPFTYNPHQEDVDNDGVGDVCDNCKGKPNHEQSDVDGDGVGDDCDNCQFTPNADQSDIDLDGFGDVCDNCMRTANADQKDTDHDGIGDVCEGEDQGVGTLTPIGEPVSAIRFVGDKRYELSNHLGNVLSVITDRKLVGGVTGYLADVISYSDYDPYGMQVPNRFYNGADYRYGFNGMEKDDELKGNGNSYTTTWRQYDPRIGRWLTIDPKDDHPNQVGISPYAQAWNNPILFKDPDGDCPFCWGFIIGAAVEYSSQVAIGVIKGQTFAEAAKNVNMKQVFVAGISGGLSGGLSAIKVIGTTAKIYKVVAELSIVTAESVAKQVVDDGFDGKVKAKKVVFDVVASRIPILPKQLKVGKATERAIATTQRQLDRATRLATVSRVSRAAAVEEATERLTILNVKKNIGEGINKLSDGVPQNLISEGAGTVTAEPEPTYVYNISYLYANGNTGWSNYSYPSLKEAKTELSKEKTRKARGDESLNGVKEMKIEKIEVKQ